MTIRQKTLAWGIGILLWINLLSILLSSWQFGYTDWRTVAQMGLIALPPLFVGILLFCGLPRLLQGDRRDEASPAGLPGGQAPVGVGR